MRRWGLVALAGLALGGAAAAQSGREDRREDARTLWRANPAKVAATELAFARAAQVKGQWTAFLDFSTNRAVMFVPQATDAQRWLRGRANPPAAVRWQPHQVWSSCDGSLAVTKGAWQRADGTVGYFTTVWERQGDGEYRWVLDQGDRLDTALAAPEMIGGEVAQCAGSERLPDPRRRRAPRPQPVPIAAPQCIGAECRGGGASLDGTLAYSYATTARGRTFVVQLRKNGAMAEVLRSDVSES